MALFSTDETALIGVLAFAVLFPIALLSELEASSVLTVLSTRILGGMFRSPVAWFFFYILSMLWCIMLFFSSTWLLKQSSYWLLFNCTNSCIRNIRLFPTARATGLVPSTRGTSRLTGITNSRFRSVNRRAVLLRINWHTLCR